MLNLLVYINIHFCQPLTPVLEKMLPVHLPVLSIVFYQSNFNKLASKFYKFLFWISKYEFGWEDSMDISESVLKISSDLCTNIIMSTDTNLSNSAKTKRCKNNLHLVLHVCVCYYLCFVLHIVALVRDLFLNGMV